MDKSSTTMTILEAAQHFLTMGWRPIPVPPRTKAPVIKGWQNLCLVDSDLSAYFSNPGNIGLLLGEASGGLVDVDLDTMPFLLQKSSSQIHLKQDCRFWLSGRWSS